MGITYCKLSEILSDMHSGGTPSTEVSEYWNGNLKWLSSGETSQRFIYDTISKITEEGVKKSSTKLAKKGNVVMACAGQGKTRGQTSFVMNDMYVNQSVIVLEADEEKVLPLYLFYDLSNRYDELRGGSDASSTRGSITTTTLKKLPFGYPDKSTQKKIIDILYNYDLLIENNSKRIKLLEQTAEEIYKEWFVRFRFPGYETAEIENGIPKEWEIKKVKDVTKRLPFGKTYKSDELEREGRVIVIDQSENELLGYHDNDPSHKATMDDPIVIFGDHSCKFQLMTKDFSLGENVIPFTVNNKDFSVYYLYYATKGLLKTEEYKRHWGRLVNFKIFIPDPDLQHKFEDRIKPLIEQIEVLWNCNQNIIKQRDYLLPRLMSGKLEV